MPEAPKIPVKLQQRLAAEAQQEAHPLKVGKPLERPTFKIVKPKPVAPKAPGLRERAAKFLTRKGKAVTKAAETVEAVAKPATKIGKAISVGGKVLRGVGALGTVAEVATGLAAAASIGEVTYKAEKAAASLQRQAKHAERKYGLKVKVGYPPISKGFSGLKEGPKVDITYPKPPPLSEKAKARLKGLGQ